MDKRVTSELLIFDISDTCAPVSGGKKIMLFHDKISRQRVGIRFYEKNQNGDKVWQSVIEDHVVHRQVALSFKTPIYHNLDIEAPVKVYFELFLTDGKCSISSKPIEFEFHPIESNVQMAKKRKRVQNQDYCEYSRAEALNQMNTVLIVPIFSHRIEIQGRHSRKHLPSCNACRSSGSVQSDHTRSWSAISATHQSGANCTTAIVCAQCRSSCNASTLGTSGHGREDTATSLRTAPIQYATWHLSPACFRFYARTQGQLGHDQCLI